MLQFSQIQADDQGGILSKLIIVILLFFSFPTFAKVNCGGGVQFDDTVTIEDDAKTLIDLDLNGVGKKKVLFFNVFYAALYLENMSNKSELIIQSNEHKVGIIHATRNISKSQLTDMFNQEFERLCKDQCDELRPHHEQLLSYIRNIKKNERLFLINFPDRFELEVNMEETFDPIYSPAYSRLLQNMLFGPDASDPELKKGLLGQKKICKAA